MKVKLIVGLGNPGKLYIDSRHNLGFQVVRKLAKAHKVLLARDSAAFSLAGQAKIEGQGVILALPTTFMNLSGVAVKALVKKYRIDLGNLFVVCDDLDLEFGRLRVRGSGSSAGHRGLESIIKTLKSQDFCRLRIGIGRPQRNISNRPDAAEYVLSLFTKKEREQLGGIKEEACDCCRVWVSCGLSKSMNRFNKRNQ